MTDVATSGGVQAVVAGKDAQLELRVKGSHPDGTACQFQIYKAADDSLLDTIDGQVEKGKATTLWPAKGPEETGPDRAHRVYYVVTVNSKEKTTSPELEVYHDRVEVTSQAEDGGALADVGFELSVDTGGFGFGVCGSTGSTGSFVVDNLPPGDVDVTWSSPARLLEWVEQRATAWRAKVKNAFKARLNWPPAGAHKQWVNHPPKVGQPDQGHVLKVRVGRHKDDGPSKKGDELFLKLEYPPAERLSKRTTPARGVKGGAEQPWSKPMPGLSKKVEADGGEVEFEVELGLAGGDTVKVHVGGTEACDDEVVEVTNWRRLYYQVTAGATTKLHPFTKVDEHLAPAFVVYERFKAATFKQEETPADMAGSWQKGAELGRTADDEKEETFLVVGSHNRDWFRNKFDASKGKLSIDLVVCDLQYDGGTAAKPNNVTVTDVLTTAEQVVTVDAAKKWIFPRALLDGKHPFVSGRWETVGAPPDETKRGDMTKDMVVVDVLSRKVKVKLPSTTANDPGSLVGDGTGGRYKIRCTFKLRYGSGPWLGESSGQHQLVVQTAHEAPFYETVLHELGHNMKQVVSGKNAPPAGLSLADHPHAYEDHGHQGPHCSFGLDEAGATHVLTQQPDKTWTHEALSGAATAQADYRRLKKQQGAEYVTVWGTCLMYGGGSSKATSAQATAGFCEECLPFLKAQALEDLT